MTPERFARIVLLASALAFAAPGVGFLLAPDRFGAAVDLALLSTTASSDVRAVFGGLELGVAALLAAAALGAFAWRTALVVQLCALGGMLGGRIVSLALDGAPGPFAALLFAIEAALFAAGLLSVRAARAARVAGT